MQTTSAFALNTIGSEPQVPVLKKQEDDGKLKETFRQFVGEAFFGQMLSSMRKTVGESPYFHGGQGERVFQGQLDQKMAEELAVSSADRFADPMFDLFMLQSRS